MARQGRGINLAYTTMTKALSVLIVEDAPLLARSIGRFLRGHGCEPEVCADGAAAMELLEKRRYNVLITDLGLPGLGGMELVEYVLSHDSRCKIIAISGAGNQDADRETKRNARRFQYLQKPFDLVDLLPCIMKSGKRKK